MAFEFCRDMSETQIKDLETKMEKCMTLVTCVCNDQVSSCIILFVLEKIFKLINKTL